MLYRQIAYRALWLARLGLDVVLKDGFRDLPIGQKAAPNQRAHTPCGLRDLRVNNYVLIADVSM